MIDALIQKYLGKIILSEALYDDPKGQKIPLKNLKDFAELIRKHNVYKDPSVSGSKLIMYYSSAKISNLNSSMSFTKIEIEDKASGKVSIKKNIPYIPAVDSKEFSLNKNTTPMKLLDKINGALNSSRGGKSTRNTSIVP